MSIHEASVAPLLRVERVSRRFGGVQALDGVSLTVEEGTIHGLIGPNGAGKTTLLNAIGGQTTIDSGGIVLGDRSIAGERPDRIAALGARRTFQGATPLRGMTVLDNVLAGMHLRRASHGERRRLRRARWSSRADCKQAARDLLGDFGLGAVQHVDAGTLSFGHMRMLEITRAVAVRPRLLLLDEPAAGLSEADVDRLGATLRDLRATGMTIVVVDHDVGFIVGACDRITVLNFGKVIGQGAPEDILASADVREAYLGSWGSADG